MELRPFRSLRYSPRILMERGLPALIAPPVNLPPGNAGAATAAPENILRLVLPPRGGVGRPAAAAETLRAWRDAGILIGERRPGLWLYRQTIPGRPAPRLVSMLVGLVRLGPAPPTAHRPPETPDSRSPEERLAMLKTMKADFEPCLLLTRAPLSGALSTTRFPDLSAEDDAGIRHDAYRIHDYAQHVELQGLVKSADVVLAAGRDLWETARQFQEDPAAEKLSSARFKLCALLEEASLREHRGEPLPATALGLFGVSLEDPVY
jgi:hypothetical protein